MPRAIDNHAEHQIREHYERQKTLLAQRGALCEALDRGEIRGVAFDAEFDELTQQIELGFCQLQGVLSHCFETATPLRRTG